MVVEARGALRVDRAALGGQVPVLRGLDGVDDFTAHLTRKKFVFSAGHASAAYVGGLAGHATLPAALADPVVRTVVAARCCGRGGEASRPCSATSSAAPTTTSTGPSSGSGAPRSPTPCTGSVATRVASSRAATGSAARRWALAGGTVPAASR